MLALGAMPRALTGLTECSTLNMRDFRLELDGAPSVEVL